MRRFAQPILFLLITLAVALLSCQKQPPASREQHLASAPTPNNGPSPTPLNNFAGYPAPVLHKPYPGTGVVDLINKKEGWIEITHEEIKDLMAAMQMEFNVQDKSLLDKVSVGDRVNFTIVHTEKGEYLTEIQRVPKTSP